MPLIAGFGMLIHTKSRRTKNKIMKKYIGTKEVNATPAWRIDGKVYPKDGAVPRVMNREDGYKVVYEDGHESWSPKDVFEKAYKPADTFLDRLFIEMRDLYSKMDKLAPFIASGKIDEVITDKYQNLLLRLQHRIMNRYINVLECRIGRIDGSPEAPLHLMSFGDAIEILKQGGAIRRKGWNGKGLFVVKQVPAHITEEIIPKMQSLPQSAKNIIMARDNKYIDYTNQMLIINPDGRADSWVPSSSDVFAEDWEIVVSE